jgi:hypothetical protein
MYTSEGSIEKEIKERLALLKEVKEEKYGEIVEVGDEKLLKELSRRPVTNILYYGDDPSLNLEWGT